MYNNSSPRKNLILPPIDDPKMQFIEDRLRKQEETTNGLIDRAVKIKEDIVNSQEFIRGSITDERKNRQLLEEHIRVITAVCKKLNFDIEALETQLNEKAYQMSNMDLKLRETENSAYNKELQYKVNRTESSISKLEMDHGNVINMIKDLQAQFQDFGRAINSRMNDIDRRVSDMSVKFDSVLSEQTSVLRNVEGDTIKHFQSIDAKTRGMIEDIREQMNTNKTSFDNEISKIESRLSLKIDESLKNSDKYERIDRRLEDLASSQNKKYQTFEEEFQRNISKINLSVEKLEQKVYRGIEEKQVKLTSDYDKLKKELRGGFESIKDSISSLQKLTDDKIRLAEEKLVKDIDKVKKMVVLI